MLGQELLALRRNAEATRELRQALALRPELADEPQHRELTIAYTRRLATGASDERDGAEALRWVAASGAQRRLRSMDRDRHVGRSLCRIGRYDEAISQMQKVLSRAPGQRRCERGSKSPRRRLALYRSGNPLREQDEPAAFQALSGREGAMLGTGGAPFFPVKETIARPAFVLSRALGRPAISAWISACTPCQPATRVSARTGTGFLPSLAAHAGQSIHVRVCGERPSRPVSVVLPHTQSSDSDTSLATLALTARMLRLAWRHRWGLLRPGGATGCATGHGARWFDPDPGWRST